MKSFEIEYLKEILFCVLTYLLMKGGKVMWFWVFMFICNLMIPPIMIIAGRMMWKHCPKEINAVIGYRTSASMKNMDTWKFAHEYCGRLWWKLGWIILVPSIIIQILFINSTEDTIGIVGGIICTVQMVVLIAAIFPTEMALKKNFNKDGSRK